MWLNACRPSWDYMADDRDLEVKFDRTNDNWQTGESWSGRVQGLWLQHCSSCIAGWAPAEGPSCPLPFLHSIPWSFQRRVTLSLPPCL